MRSRDTELLFIYLIFDLFFLNSAIFIAAHLQLFKTIEGINIYFLHGNLSWCITYFVFSKKNLQLRDGFVNRFWRITKRLIVFQLISALLAFLVIPNRFSTSFFLEYLGIFYISKTIFYWFLYQFLVYKRKKGRNTSRALIVDLNGAGNLLRKLIKNEPILGYNFIGYLKPVGYKSNYVLGTPRNLEHIIDQYQVQIVFVTLSFFTEGNNLKDILSICNRKGVRLRLVPEKQKWFRRKRGGDSIGGVMMINPQEIPLDDASLRVQKRLFDVVFSFCVIVFLFSWLLPIMALLIKLESRGPVFFAQNRTGINNKTFKCLKFRSMKVNKDSDSKQATAGDTRITKIGNFMRKTNIDELPQFFNVFMGHMSVVGPRPHMLKHTDEYSALINNYLVRHYVKPGVTGWAQVNGYRGETNELWKMEKRVEFDMKYIENWTFPFDIKIIWMTFFGKDALKNAG